MQEETATLNTKMEDMEHMMDCVKLMLKFIMGTCTNQNVEYPLNQATSNLKGKGLAMFNECMAAMDGKDFSFSRYNLYLGRVGS